MKVGVIGGNGVASTNRLLDLIERKGTQNGAYRDAHHPELVVFYATQSPSRSMYLEGRGPSFVPGYVEIAREMKRLGCHEGCICCNTAHYAIAEIEKASGLPFINVLEEVALKAGKKDGMKPAISTRYQSYERRIKSHGFDSLKCKTRQLTAKVSSGGEVSYG